jgi:UDP-3-O-[3-hydroxymyristoyl] glucosamine N-acyltransferase
MEFSAAQIAEMLNGEVDGDKAVMINDLSKIEEGRPGTLTFLANPKYEQYIYTTEASLAVVAKDFVADQKIPSTLTLLRVEDPRTSFATLLKAYDQMMAMPPGISSAAMIDDQASIGENVHIGAGVIVGAGSVVGDNSVLHAGSQLGNQVALGADCILHPGARVLDRCKIGDHVTLHSGVIIGSDGFGFAPNSEGNYNKVPQIGNVVIEDHVEIGANTAVDRATLGSTIIRKGVKIDNLIQIAHNVEIGDNTVIAAQTGIAGSTKIGKNCMIGGQVGIVGHITIADGVKIAAQSGIGNSITQEGAIVQGSPAFSIMDYKKSYVGFRKLPSIMNDLSDLQRSISQFKKE